MTNKGEKTEYLLFTRINRGDDLILVGSLNAESDELARGYALHIYNEEDWVEMQIVPKKSFIPIRLPEPLFN